MRIRFPFHQFDNKIPTRNISEVEKEQELTAGVHRARLIPDNRLYIYKEVDRPLYEPRDADVLEQELQPWQGWALQIALGLCELHRQGLAHMDLKPSNVVIRAEDNAILLDISG